jgi:hypothetical protein
VVSPSPSPPPATPKANAEQRAEFEAAKAKATAKARAKARARAAARKAKLARARVDQRESGSKDRVPALARPRTEQNRDLLGSPLAYMLLVTASGLALISIMLAVLPLGALERLLATQAHYRTEQVADFVDGHRLDIAVAGVGTLLVAAAVALPTVTG